MPTFLTFTPPRPPAPGTQNKPEVKILENEFGNGYTQSIGDGRNNVRRVISLSWETLVPAEWAAMNQFFFDRRGCEPFFWTPSDETTPVLWTCKDWGDERQDSGFYKFQATFRQSFIPT